MKCANCLEEIKNRCDKEGYDCLKGKLDLPEYFEEENQPHHRISGYLQHEHGNNLTRLEELIKFCQYMEYKRIGIAFCVGLAEEASILAQILSQYFKVESVCCKIGGLDKKDYEVPNRKPDKKEILCNPIAQAVLLNKAKTDINVEVGLCIGHDTLFHKYSEAPVTVFAVKDRMMGHNPLGVLYCSYWKKKLKVKTRTCSETLCSAGQSKKP